MNQNLDKVAGRVQKEIGDRGVVNTIQYGIQVTLTGYHIRMMFYYGKRGFKYVRTDTGNSQPFPKGQEGSIVINTLSILKAQAEKKQAKAIVKEVPESGVDAFVNAIKKKLAHYKKVHKVPTGQETEAMVIMQTIINEADQYRDI